MRTNIRVCLDLNIWCSALLSDRKGNQGSACQYLVKYAKDGFYDFGRFYLIISLGMLERLEMVLQRKEIGLTANAAKFYVAITADKNWANISTIQMRVIR